MTLEIILYIIMKMPFIFELQILFNFGYTM